MNNFLILILDGVGVGELPDADKYGDLGTNTLGNISRKVGGLDLPNLQKAGLGNITEIVGVPPEEKPLASFGKMTEVSAGKDSTTGHWEIAGLRIEKSFPVFPNGFPDEVIEKFKELNGFEGVLCNKPASGTEVIARLGDEHVETGFPIVYTSADSVFQIAAHEDVIPLEKLYEICRVTREKVCTGKYSVGRVIARPFVGESGNYTRTTNRKDFSVSPFSDTIIDYCKNEGIPTVAIGKINDLFNYSGITESIITKTNDKGIDTTITKLKEAKDSFLFTNLVDFDVYYGHRNDPEGFAKALTEFDNRLPEIIEAMDESDVMVITSDHGNDPTLKSTDHSREYVPLLMFRKGQNGRNLGTRNTYSDVAQTVAAFFKVNNALYGESFL